MSEDKSLNSQKKLFNKLQEESWHLELLVSGFVVVGLFYGIEPLAKAENIAYIEGNNFMGSLYRVGSLAVMILLFNLVFHLILRSLWIGALGLRSVSGEIDIDQLHYSKKFSNYLKRKVGSFDDYIEKLERFSSIIFAISFLLIFYSISLMIVMKIFMFFYELTSDDLGGVLYFLANLILIFLVIGSVFTFIDFLTLGFLKKKKYLSKIYFPFYLVFSTLTLSFLYRPLVYNFLDNKFGRIVSMLLLPVYIVIILLSDVHYQKSNYITYKIMKESPAVMVNDFNYEDIIAQNNAYTNTFSIQSKVIQDNYIKVKIPISKDLDDEIFELDNSLRPEIDARGYKIGSININIHSTTERREQFLKTFQENYFFKIDERVYKADFVIGYKDPSVWFETYIGIKGLEEGKHTISFVKYKSKNTDTLETIKTIPFWYYKDAPLNSVPF